MVVTALSLAVAEPAAMRAGGRLAPTADRHSALLYLVLPDPGDDSPVMGAYRARFETSIGSYLDTSSAPQVARIFRDSTDAEVTAARAARLRLRQAALIKAANGRRAEQAELLGAADELGDFAAALEDSLKEDQL